MTAAIDKYIGVKYKLKSSENFEDYLKFIEVGYLSRKTACAVTPIAVLTKDGDTYTFTMGTSFRTVTFSFKPNEEFDEERPDGAKVKSVMTFEGGKLIQIQVEANGRKSRHERNFTPELLTTITTAEGWDGKCIRIYEVVK